MIRFLFPCLFVFSGCLLCGAGSAQAVYKCSQGGKVSYGDRPCADGRGTRLAPPAAGVTPPEAGAVAARDARTLLELEKLRIGREKDDAREQRDQARQARAAQARHKHCATLRLRHKWALEDLARADGKSQEAARRKARRQAEALVVECPA